MDMETNELINQLREQLADALVKNEVLEAEFELALDMAEQCCNAVSKDDALAIRQKFITESSFEGAKRVLAGLKKRIEVLESKNVFVGYTNGYQIHCAKESEGFFYPNTDNECYIPLYMLAIHEHRLELYTRGESNDD